MYCLSTDKRSTAHGQDAVPTVPEHRLVPAIFFQRFGTSLAQLPAGDHLEAIYKGRWQHPRRQSKSGQTGPDLPVFLGPGGPLAGQDS